MLRQLVPPSFSPRVSRIFLLRPSVFRSCVALRLPLLTCPPRRLYLNNDSKIVLEDIGRGGRETCLFCVPSVRGFSKVLMDIRTDSGGRGGNKEARRGHPSHGCYVGNLHKLCFFSGLAKPCCYGADGAKPEDTPQIILVGHLHFGKSPRLSGERPAREERF